MAYPICTKIRVRPRTGLSGRLEGVKVYGSNTSASAGLVELHTLTGIVDGWNERTFANTAEYRYLLIKGSTGFTSECSELEFYAGNTKLTPVTTFGGTPFSPDYAPAKAFDGNAGTDWAVGTGSPADAFVGMESQNVVFVGITSESPLPAVSAGSPYSYQLTKTGGSGTGTWSATGGNLPVGALASNGLITIPVTGNVNYTFMARFTDANGTFVEKTFTIPVSNLQSITLCFKRPRSIAYIQKQRLFEPIEGADEVIEDAAQKREWTGTIQYIGIAEGNSIRQFLYNHRLRQPFLWINPDRQNETIAVKMVSPYSEQEMLAYGDFEITIREI